MNKELKKLLAILDKANLKDKTIYVIDCLKYHSITCVAGSHRFASYVEEGIEKLSYIKKAIQSGQRALNLIEVKGLEYYIKFEKDMLKYSKTKEYLDYMGSRPKKEYPVIYTTLEELR